MPWGGSGALGDFAPAAPRAVVVVVVGGGAGSMTMFANPLHPRLLPASPPSGPPPFPRPGVGRQVRRLLARPARAALTKGRHETRIPASRRPLLCRPAGTAAGVASWVSGRAALERARGRELPGRSAASRVTAKLRVMCRGLHERTAQNKAACATCLLTQLHLALQSAQHCHSDCEVLQNTGGHSHHKYTAQLGGYEDLRKSGNLVRNKLTLHHRTKYDSIKHIRSGVVEEDLREKNDFVYRLLLSACPPEICLHQMQAAQKLCW